MSEHKDDKSFEPTEQKLRKAREQGDVPRSTEFNTAMMYLGAWLAFAVAAGLAVKQWLALAGRALGAGGGLSDRCLRWRDRCGVMRRLPWSC